jgi:hypothetical protein
VTRRAVGLVEISGYRENITERLPVRSSEYWPFLLSYGRARGTELLFTLSCFIHKIQLRRAHQMNLDHQHIRLLEGTQLFMLKFKNHSNLFLR